MSSRNILLSVLVMVLAGGTVAQAQIFSENFNAIPEIVDWQPDFAIDGFARTAGQASIGNGLGNGSRGLEMLNPGAGSTIYWNASLDKATVPVQVAEVDFMFDSGRSGDNLTEINFYMQENNGSGGYVGWINVEYADSNPGSGRVIGTPGYTNVPMTVPALAFDTWYNVTLEADYNTGQIRGQFGDSGFSDWIDMVSTAQMGAVRLDGFSDTHYDNFKFGPIPEPTTMALVSLGLAAMAGRRRR